MAFGETTPHFKAERLGLSRWVPLEFKQAGRVPKSELGWAMRNHFQERSAKCEKELAILAENFVSPSPFALELS